jgi:hypothetical protein
MDLKVDQMLQSCLLEVQLDVVLYVGIVRGWEVEM